MIIENIEEAIASNVFHRAYWAKTESHVMLVIDEHHVVHIGLNRLMKTYIKTKVFRDKYLLVNNRLELYKRTTLNMKILPVDIEASKPPFFSSREEAIDYLTRLLLDEMIEIKRKLEIYPKIIDSLKGLIKDEL